MKYEPLAIPDVILMTPKVFGDERGFFMETFRQSDFESHCGEYQFVQDNHSKSTQNTLRGLHYQATQPQGKLVRATQGEVFDVAIDMRANSPSFGQWVGATLSSENKQLLWIPPGFAHGFYVVSETAEVMYKCTRYYAPQDECAIRWDDPELGIEWPLVAANPLISNKDEMAKSFQDAPAIRVGL